MATFEIGLPTGEKYRVDGPDDMTPEQAYSHVQSQHAVPAAQPGVAEDVAKSGGIGLVKGGIGLAGTGSDIREMQAGLLSKGAGALGLDVAPETISKGLRFIPGMAGPTSQDITSVVEKATGPLYQPKTTAGEYTQTLGEFLPSLAFPESGAASLGRRVLTNVVAPALASETAGH
jgi:hypothetical protein